MGGQGDPLGIVQKFEIWPNEQMVCAQTRICPKEWHTQTPLGFWDTNGSPNLGQTTRPYNNHRKERTWRIVDFAIPADHIVEWKKCQKRNKYLDLVRELKKLWNMKVAIISIVIGALGTVTKGLVQGPKDLGMTSGDSPNYSIVEIGQNTVKSPGDLMRLAVTQTPVENHQR